jgi:hypothetical protein
MAGLFVLGLQYGIRQAALSFLSFPGTKSRNGVTHKGCNAMRSPFACGKLLFLLNRPLPLLVLALFAALSGRAGVFDDFNDGNDAGWTHYNPIGTGSWSVSGGAYRLQSGVSPSPSTVGPGRAGSLRTTETYSQFSASVDIVAWDNSLDQIFGLITRVTTPGLGTTKGYGFTYATRTGRATTGQLQMLLIAEEAGTDIIPAVNFTFVAGQSYRMVFEGVIDSLTAKLFSTTNLATPLATLTASNTTYTSGGVGFFTYDNSRTGAGRADVTFDNFASAELGPKLQIARDISSTDIFVSWPNWATTYRLERSYTSGPFDWVDLGVGLDQFDGKFIMFDDGTLPFACYRLVTP